MTRMMLGGRLVVGCCPGRPTADAAKRASMPQTMGRIYRTRARSGFPHNFRSLLARFQQLCHALHLRPRMPEERQESRTQVVQTLFSVGRHRKPILGASPVAGEPHVAGLAHLGERISLVSSELPLLGK